MNHYTEFEIYRNPIVMTDNDDDDDDFSPVGDDDDEHRGHGMPRSPFDDMIDQAQRMLNKALSGNVPPQHRNNGGGNNSDTPYLDKYSTDLTAQARDNRLDPVVGRENEIRRLIEILGRRKKNNPVLIGDPGVGKSAIVEGLAQMIVSAGVSPVLRNKRLLALDLTGIVAGTQYRGDFEKRMKGIINELEKQKDVIVFIDEIHTLMGAGSGSGTMDAANILKPSLARGVIQCIGATTLDEYRKSIEKDGALERRFQKIIINPTTSEDTLLILERIKDHYQKHHHVVYTPEALRACVDQTGRYVTDRVFPDKAIDALDEVGSRVHLRSAKESSAMKRLEKEIEEMAAAKRSAVLRQNFEMAAAYRDRIKTLNQRLEKLRLQGDESEAIPVTEFDVNEVISMMTGVPVQRVSEGETARLRKLDEKLKSSVIGQDHAIETVVRAIQRNRIGLRAPNHPIGAFMFLGPTGVGKTYLAQQIAKEVFGSVDALIRVDMSEFKESFNTSRLVGAPPGYVGYDEGGQLTERVRRRPYSVVLLDEIEKAHPNVYNMLLQVLDEGRLTDGNGRTIDFRNTIIIMTSNTGTRQLKDFSRGVGFSAHGVTFNTEGIIVNEDDKQYARDIIRKALAKQFAPEFLNRLDEIITFDQLTLPSIKAIIDIEMKGLLKRISGLGYTLRLSEKAKEYIATKGYDVQFGARPLKRAIQQYIEDNVCQLIINGDLQTGDCIKVKMPKNATELKFEIAK